MLHIQSERPPLGGLWYHSTILYPIAFLSIIAPFRSALIHPFSVPSKNFYICQFIFSTFLTYLNWSAKFGNSPARLYISPNRAPNNEPVASIFSKITFSFANGYIWKGYWETITEGQIWELREDDIALIVMKRFKKFSSTLGFGWAFIRTFKMKFIAGATVAAVYAMAMFGPAMFIKLILSYIENPTVPKNVAWLYVVGILFFSVLKSLCNGLALQIGRQMALQSRAILISSIYNKALRRKASAQAAALGKEKEKEKKKTEGEDEDKDKGKDKEATGTQANVGAIINLMSVDAFKVAELMPGLHYFTSGILQLVFAMLFLWQLLGWSALVGSIGMLIVLPINYLFAKKFAQIQKDLMAVTDQRVEKMNELLQAIRIIKFFAWEDKFADGVLEVREKELKVLRRRFTLFIFGAGLFFATPIFITVITFASYTMLQKQSLTAPIAFTSLAVFNLMKNPLDMLAFLFTEVLQAKVSFNRIQEFLAEDETEKYNQLSSSRDTARLPGQPYIGFQDASFSWSGVTDNGSDKNKNAAETENLGSSTKDNNNTPKVNNFKLKDLNIEFPVSKLTVIAGATGSGKTSMLMALLGEMDLDQGKVFLPGACSREDVKIDERTGFTETVAYCSQQAWLLNDTLKNNILFAAEFNEERYNKVIKACQLERDLEILDNGDQTLVGEKGITLSGGQKQRISLARAVYSSSKHLILDDCLSAVDSHTALNIYNDCITGDVTKGRTIILVSHNVALSISQADKVVYVESGRVKAQGTPQEVLATGVLGDDELLHNSSSQAPTRANSSDDLLKNEENKHKKDRAEEQAVGEEPSKQPKSDAKLDEEYVAIGAVDKRVLYNYMAAMGKTLFWLTLLALFIAQQVSNVSLSWWIREWTNKGMVEKVVEKVTSVHVSMNELGGKMYATWSVLGSSNNSSDDYEFIVTNNEPAHSIWYYLLMYVFIGVCYLAAAMLREAVCYVGGLKASRLIFKKLLISIIRARSRFFDSTPVGRIMNRFSKDVEAMDQDLTPLTIDFFACILTLFTTLGLICFITPPFTIAAFIIFIGYFGIATFYLTSSRELKRLDSVTRSPIFQLFGETLNGITTIRAYGDQRRFIRENLAKIDKNHRPYYYLWMANRWLYFRVETVGGLVCSGAAFFAILSLGKIDSGLAGLSLSYALTFTEVTLWSVRIYAELELQGNSLERVQEYTEVEPEAEPIIEDNRPPVEWPSKGEIEFNDLSLRYAPELPLVIKNATFTVPSFNKVGVVGRTGAGKSTIITALFRLIEADSGFIKVDGLDISTIGLQDLRQALAIIPQDPTLFTGTIRSNLDPFGYYSDVQVFEALRRVHLVPAVPDTDTEATSSSAVSQYSENTNQFLDLNSAVTEGGNNLSQGQRQLMCLARSLLKTPKVLLLDEATASIDYETDSKIQNTIRQEFDQTTLLTIAHRLRSIIDYDKILVMDAGCIAEYDEPHTLLQKKDGIFRSMCENSGEFEALTKLAKEAYDNNNNNK